MIHSHWTYLAYDKREPIKENPNPNNFMRFFAVEIAIDADTEKEALEKAKGTIKRKYYDLLKVFRCEKDHELQEDMQMLNLKYMEKVMKLIK